MTAAPGPAATGAPAAPPSDAAPTTGMPQSPVAAESADATGNAAEATMHAADADTRTAATTIQAGDRVILLEPESGFRHLVRLDGGGARKQKGLGVFDPARFDGEPWGARVEVAGKAMVLLRPTLPDLAATLRRKAQIITPKDASRIVWELGLSHGDRVLESGIGSGGATLSLAHAVGPTGEVVAQELRAEFADWALENMATAGLADRLQVVVGDLTEGLATGIEGRFDACLLDLPEPWLAIPHVVPALAPGTRIACYTPQVSQMEQAARALETAGFVDVRCMELIERRWEVKERGSRPAFEGLGHTGFLVFGRWISPVPS